MWHRLSFMQHFKNMDLRELFHVTREAVWLLSNFLVRKIPVFNIFLSEGLLLDWAVLLLNDFDPPPKKRFISIFGKLNIVQQLMCVVYLTVHTSAYIDVMSQLMGFAPGDIEITNRSYQKLEI